MASSTAEHILRQTIEVIDAHGEGAVRVKELADEVGVAVTSLYHFFGSREGLIEAAQGRRYATSLRQLAGEWEAQLRGCRSQRELRALFRRQVHELGSPDHLGQRRAALSVVGSAHGRPQLRVAIAQAQRDAISMVAAALTVPQHKGWVRRDLDLEGFAAWYIGQLTNCALVELASPIVDSDAWNRVVTEAVVAVVFGEVSVLQRA